MRIGIVQMRLSSDLRTNSKNIVRYIERARSKKIRLLCFPECALTGYIRNHRQLHASDVASEILKLQKASDSSGVSLVVGSSLPSKGRIFNSAFIITPHSKIRKYFKHTLTDYDQEYFVHGKKRLQSFRIGDIDCGVLICRDQNDPLLPRRFKKISVLFYLSSHYYESRDLAQKERKNKAFPIVRAIENNVYVAKADAVGSQDGLVSVGTSMIVNPTGVVIAEAPCMKETLLKMDL
jgi:predicted amidohydrolase